MERPTRLTLLSSARLLLPIPKSASFRTILTPGKPTNKVSLTHTGIQYYKTLDTVSEQKKPRFG